MKHIALIPARQGSKSIKDKNLQRIGGTSLVELALQTAKKAKIFTQIILSTDIPFLIEDLKEESWLTIAERPEHLASDEALMQDVVLDVISRGDIISVDQDPTYIWLFQPTSPGRTIQDIKNIQTILESKKPASIISVCSVGANHPSRMYTISADKMYPVSGKHTNFLNKQDLKNNIYIRNGCFYILDVTKFKADFNKVLPNRFHANAFHIHPCIPYIMDKRKSINIDDPIDLELARILLR